MGREALAFWPLKPEEERKAMSFVDNILCHWGGGMMGGYGGYGMGYGMGWFGGIIMAVFWVLVIIGLVFLIRWLAASAKAGTRGTGVVESPLDILKKRYARGEMNKEEFEEKKKDIS